MIKTIAFYLPQFHSFPENDKWWGKGFTEWTNTKKTIPQYRHHYEPREPLDDNYYNLLDNETFRWQIDLAHQYGIYGFCFYHYWFNDDTKLMFQPLENFLKDKSLKQKFCLSWANETWSRRWNGSDQDILIKQEYGNQDSWIKHFEYLLPFFEDERYIRINNKPLFILYKPEIFPEYREMFKLWQKLAKDHGLDGLTFAVQGAVWNNIPNVDDSDVDLRIMYEPGFTGTQSHKEKGLQFGISSMWMKLRSRLNSQSDVQFRSYDAYCKNILSRKVISEKFVPGFFVNWDNTPRKGTNGSSFLGSSPVKFKRYFSRLIRKTEKEYHQDYIFINAWNEWAEGCYLEPDKRYKYGYLKALHDALAENNQL